MAAAPAYRFGRGTVCSDIPLAELPAVARGSSADLMVQRGSVPVTDGWDRDWRVGDEVSQRLARLPEGFLLRIEDRVDCLVSRDASQVTVASELPDAELGRLVVHQVLPLVFARQGALLLHASAAVLEGRAVAFVGASGVGKSTAAATLAVGGARLLADDALWIGSPDDRWGCLGTYPGIWLSAAACVTLAIEHPPTTADKKVLVLQGDAVGPAVPLGAVFSIVESEEEERDALIIEPLSSAELYFSLYDNTFQLDPSDRSEAARVFERLTELVEEVRGWRLKIPDSHARMPSVCARIREVASAAFLPTG